MKRIAMIACLVAAVSGCASGKGPTVHTDGTCSHPFPGNTGIQACVYAGGSLYSISYPQANQYYWRPANGYFAVAETFYKKNAPGRAAGAWLGRTISVGDNCVIDENWIPSVKTPPPDCMDSRTGENRGPTGVEEQSVLKFWQIMTEYIPASER